MPVRVEAQVWEEDVLAEERDVQVVPPAVHLHRGLCLLAGGGGERVGWSTQALCFSRGQT